MFLFVDYKPNIIVNEETGGETSNSRLVVGTPIGEEASLQMAKVNSFEGDQADLMYGLLVGVNENGDVKDIEKETVE